MYNWPFICNYRGPKSDFVYKKSEFRPLFIKLSISAIAGLFCRQSRPADTTIFGERKKLTTTQTAANLSGVKVFGVFNKDLFWETGKMRSHISLFAIVILTSLVCDGFAQEAATAPEKSVIMTSDPNAVVPSFPYIAEITGDNVNIRSGPGTQYYRCGKLNTGDRVKVVKHQLPWSCIVPPVGSFSWISTQFVRIDPNNPTIGTVTGNNVRVWVGSEGLRPMYSTTWKLKLISGEKVKLLGEIKDRYYKIAPPAGAYRWVSTEYTKALGPAGQVPSPPVVATPPSDSNVVVPTKLPLEAKKLKEYYALEKQIEAEHSKPLDQQDYTEIKQALLAIAGNKETGKAARYSEFAIKQIKRFELARDVAETVKLQDDKLQQDIRRIEKAFARRLAAIQDLGRFAAVGQLQFFKSYGPGHYRIIDDSGKTVCYVLPTGSASTVDLGKLVGRNVGLVGTIEPHPPTKGALVRFVEIVELK